MSVEIKKGDWVYWFKEHDYYEENRIYDRVRSVEGGWVNFKNSSMEIGNVEKWIPTNSEVCIFGVGIPLRIDEFVKTVTKTPSRNGRTEYFMANNGTLYKQISPCTLDIESILQM